ncbi:MAG: oligosaccharide flippase family protein [Bacteroidetes bacterium]|nr:oligosaccharide flippase family protein [Bacteroidota bacterium]
MSTLARIKQLTGDSLIYGVGNILIKFISVFLIPIYTRFFQPADYGIISIANNAFALLSVFLVMGMDNAMAIFFYDEQLDSKHRTLNTRTLFSLSVAVFACLCLLVFYRPLAYWLFNNQTYNAVFIYAALNVMFMVFPNILMGWLRLHKRALHTMFFIVVGTLFNVALSLILVVYYKRGIQGLFLAQLVSSILQTIYAAYVLRKEINIVWFEKSLLKKMLKFSLPSVPAALAIWVVTSSAAFAINYFYGTAQVGLFQVASSIASAMLLLVGAFQMAWGPFAFSIKNESNAFEFYNLIFLLYLCICGALAISIACMSQWLLKVFTTEAYESAYAVLSLLSLGYILNGTVYIAALGLNFAKKNTPFAVCNIAAALFTLGCLALLVKPYIALGAAISIIAGQLLLNVFLFYVAHQKYPMPYQYTRGGILFGATVIMVVGAIYILKNNYLPWYLLLFVSNALFLFLCFFVFERSLVLKLLRSKFSKEK